MDPMAGSPLPSQRLLLTVQGHSFRSSFSRGSSGGSTITRFLQLPYVPRWSSIELAPETTLVPSPTVTRKGSLRASALHTGAPHGSKSREHPGSPFPQRAFMGAVPCSTSGPSPDRGSVTRGSSSDTRATLEAAPTQALQSPRRTVHGRKPAPQVTVGSPPPPSPLTGAVRGQRTLHCGPCAAQRSSRAGLLG